jgi:hypothetical protein
MRRVSVFGASLAMVYVAIVMIAFVVAQRPGNWTLLFIVTEPTCLLVSRYLDALAEIHWIARIPDSFLLLVTVSASLQAALLYAFGWAVGRVCGRILADPLAPPARLGPPPPDEWVVPDAGEVSRIVRGRSDAPSESADVPDGA